MPSDQDSLRAILEGTTLWMPQSVPQWAAFLSPADELYYGGAAGGGKTDLLLGLAITAHKTSIIFRRELAQFAGPTGLIERSRQIIGDDGRYNGTEYAWRDLPGGRSLQFGAMQLERDKRRYQGRLRVHRVAISVLYRLDAHDDPRTAHAGGVGRQSAYARRWAMGD